MNAVNAALPGPLGDFGTAAVLDARVGSVNDVRTPTLDNEAIAHAKAATVDLNLGFLVLTADLLRSRTTATCTPFSFAPGGSSPGSFSTVTNVQSPQINGGVPISGSTPMSFSVPFGMGTATLYLNYSDTTMDETHIRRALFLDLPDPFPDTVLAESMSGCPVIIE